jgi:hypothetical protein
LAKSLPAPQKRTPKKAVTRSQRIKINDLCPKDDNPETRSKKDEVKQPIFLKKNLKITKFKRETQ